MEWIRNIVVFSTCTNPGVHIQLSNNAVNKCLYAIVLSVPLILSHSLMYQKLQHKQ